MQILFSFRIHEKKIKKKKKERDREEKKKLPYISFLIMCLPETKIFLKFTLSIRTHNNLR